MPSGSYRQIDVGCPFYQSDDGKRHITCEGIVDDSNVTLFFRKKQDFEKQMLVFCCGHYRNCEVDRMLMEKYEEDEND